jgi:Pyruvate/2-oxoacid:ferredoxin oxidoreductase delta subunit
MRKTIWTKMIDRMNQNLAKHPETGPMVEVLKDLYTEEQASLVGDFPMGAYTPAALAQHLGREEDELNNMLTKMSRDGLIFEAASENGEAEYSVLPFAPGLLEMQLLKGKDDEKTRKFVARLKELKVAEGAVMAEVLKEPERVKEVFSKTVLRVVAIEEQVSEDKEIASWERISQIVESETSYALGECGCKHIAKLNGKPCTCGVSSKCCVWFGTTADYLVERGYADRCTKEELYTLLKECEDAGLVHCTSNQMDPHNVVLCNCCSCCCVFLRKHKAVRDLDLRVNEASNFVARVDEESCVGCGECVEYCQLDALSLSDDTVSINDYYCLGCGACIDKCPTESLSLVRISNNKPPAPEVPLAGPGV